MKTRTIKYFSLQDVPLFERSRWLFSIFRSLIREPFVNGPSIYLFERRWSEQVKMKYAIGVSNGLDGLTLALIVSDLTNGKRIAVPAHTFIACYLAILRVGGIPVPIDVTKEGLMDPKELKRVIQKVDGVMPVHMHGSMADMEHIMKIAKKFKKIVIEDASQAHMAQSNAKYAGSFGALGVFSLYPTKNLGAFGDAAVIVTNNSKLANRLRILRSYGSSPNNKYFHKEIGFNMRMDTIQASVLVSKLKNLQRNNEKRFEFAMMYYNEIKNPGVVALQKPEEGRVFHHYCILVSNRNHFFEYMKERRIECEVHYPRLAPKEIAGLTKLKFGEFPIADEISKKTISLPISPWHSKRQIRRIIEVVNNYNFVP